MAYSQEALTSLLRRKRQYEALGGRVSAHETEGIVKGVLSTEAAKDIEASRLAKEEALRKRQLDIQAGEATSMAEYRRNTIEMQKEALEDQEKAGYLRTGMDVLGSKTGQKAIGQVGKWLGIGGGGATVSAVSGLGASGIPLATAIPYAAEAVGMKGILGAIPSATAPTAVGTATPGILGIAGQVALPAAVGSLAGSWLGSQPSFQEITPWGGKKTEKMMGGALGGAAAGAAYGSIVPGVGTVIGGVIGGVIGFITGGSVICSELHRQGYITAEELELDFLYRVNIDNETYTGYMSWAPKLVELMQRSGIITQLVRPFGVGWAKEMSHRLEPERKGNLIGKLLLKFGVPICRFIGKRRESWAVGAEL